MKPIIILYYHRILPFKGYDIDINTFAWQLSYLRKNNFDIVGIEELFEVINGKSLKKTSFILSFDDGFFDNFVYAYPILKKYRSKAVIFLPTSKMQDKGVRLTLEDYWNGKVSFDKLAEPKSEATTFSDSLMGDNSEFLSWEEIDLMVRSGVFNVGSHGCLHTRCFSSDKVVDFYREDANIHWSFNYAADNDKRPGAPVYKMKSCLATKRYFDDILFRDKVIEMFQKTVDVEDSKTRRILLKEVNNLSQNGRFESEEETKDRIFNELVQSKIDIKKNLEIDTKCLSWPWGEYEDFSLGAAKQAGFDLCFSINKDCVTKNSDPYRLGRVNASKDKVRFKKRAFVYSSPLLSKVYNAVAH